MSEYLEILKRKLAKVNLQLEKYRTTTQSDGFGTMRHAKKARNWDYWSNEKFELMRKIYDEDPNFIE